jgi:secondary thiamine-phosphate synthase enzyme
MFKIHIATEQRDQFIEITDRVRKIVERSQVRHGVVTVYSPHTTAGITINENADPDVVHDMLLTLKRLVPQDSEGFRHAERNSDSHVKASMMGSSCQVIVEDGELVLGTWQGIYFCEFDGPRQRLAVVKVVEEEEGFMDGI